MYLSASRQPYPQTLIHGQAKVCLEGANRPILSFTIPSGDARWLGMLSVLPLVWHGPWMMTPPHPCFFRLLTL